MRAEPRVRPRRKRADRYHHGDLRRALLEQAVQTIDREGIAALTLRSVGEALGVSRTALYRHFADKGALLEAVAAEGFRTLRLALADAWESGGRTRDAFSAMGEAYITFARTHPSHYRVMFGGFMQKPKCDPVLAEEATGAFRALVDAIVHLQGQGTVRRDDPQRLAEFVWATVHGVAMLTIDGQLQQGRGDIADVVRFVLGRIRAGIAPEQD